MAPRSRVQHFAHANAMKWKLMNQAKAVVLNHDGIVFGGFVRDALLHDQAAKRFYAACKARGLSTQQYYTDRAFLSEAADRLTVPKDIDCLVTLSQYTDINEALEDKGFRTEVKQRQSIRHYFPCRSGERPEFHKLVDHIRVKVSLNTPACIAHHLAACSFSMDFFCTLDDAPPHRIVLNEELDFECNGLLLTKMGLQLSPAALRCYPDVDCRDPIAVLNKLHEVVQNVLQKKTTCFDVFVPDVRLKKLLNQGWTLEGDSFTTLGNVPYEGHCLVCHDPIEDRSVKLRCCDARYHFGCLHQALDFQRQQLQRGERADPGCPMCRKDMFVPNWDDMQVIESLSCATALKPCCKTPKSVSPSE